MFSSADLYYFCLYLNSYEHDRAIKMVVEGRRKLALCEKVLGVISLLTPGQVRMRGMFLSEMYGIIVFLGKRAFDEGEIGVDQFMHR